MKPFPEHSGVTLPEDAHSERPWWRAAKPYRWKRPDGMWVRPAQFTNREFWRAGHDPESKFASFGEAMAACDAAKPLPEPPFRSGQVWLFDAVQTCFVSTLQTCIFPHFDRFGKDHFEAFGRPLFRRAHDPYTDPNGMLPTGFVIEGRILSQFDGQTLLRSAHPDWDAYLIFDPCNPHGGIWTAAKEKA